MIQPIDIEAITRGDIQPYSNQVLSSVNDHDVHLSIMQAPYF